MDSRFLKPYFVCILFSEIRIKYLCLTKLPEVVSILTKLYVGNLPYSYQESNLMEMFSEYGTVVSATIITDRQSGRSKGFGFVEFEAEEEAKAAIEALNGTEVDGRKLTVNEARPRRDDM